MASAEEDGIKILSWNINGLKSKFKKQEVFDTFNEYDVVLLQETKIGKPDTGTKKKDDDDWKIIKKLSDEEYALEKLEDLEFNEDETQQETMYMTYFSSNSRGVAILINKPHTLLSAFSEGGDYAWVHVDIGNQKYTFVSVYCCGRDQNLICNVMLKIFYSFLTNAVDALNSRLVIGGDFNTTLDPKLDANKEIKAHSAGRARLTECMTITKLSDIWRKKNDSKRKYTYFHNNETKSRLDYVFMLKKDENYVINCDIHNEIKLSDHSPVSLTLKVNNAYTNPEE
ncbi:hypothetical protein ROHU_022330 [Labeo rohita]|uniref:exodeoxyribonuclease III n=1 Tax=Labeo rohita TaxID=84645 RepID=A0A498MTZ8_LABRO|nr:hypothetical protein ROHU_022330 [Labeo rohita]